MKCICGAIGENKDRPTIQHRKTCPWLKVILEELGLKPPFWRDGFWHIVKD